MSHYFDNKEKEMFMSPQVNQYGSHQVMTNVWKDTKTKYVNLDTKFCDDLYTNVSNTANTATYNLANFHFSIPEKTADVKTLSVENVEFPCMFADMSYNISSAIGNNCFSLSLASTDTLEIPDTINQTIVVSIADGNYTRAALVDTINADLSNNITTGGYTSIKHLFFNFATNNSSYYSYIYSTCIHTLKYTIQFAVDASGNFDKHNFKNKLGWLLGFRNPTYKIITDSGNTYGNNGTAVVDYPYSTVAASFAANYRAISENCFVFKPFTKYYYLVIDEFTNNFQNSFISSLPFSIINKYIIAKISVNPSLFLGNSTTAVVSATASNGYLISSKRTYTGKVDIQKLNVKLIDENGNVVNLQGYDFSFCLKMEHE